VGVTPDDPQNLDVNAGPTLVVQPRPAGDPVPRQVLLQRYEVRRLLGRGAMGEVLAVHDLQSGNDYAFKRVPAELVRDGAQMANIRANFALVSQLTHPHIGATRFFEVDQATGHAYLIMDLVHGVSLAEWLITKRLELGQTDAPLPIETVVGVAEQIAQALDYAHSQPVSRTPSGTPKVYGVLHRDLKPANVMVEEGREYRPGVPLVRIIDFGLAAEIQASLMSLSVKRENELAGTPLYMAPEQWEGRTLTRGVDQWALAVMVYEMAAGRRPFQGPSSTAIMHQICKADPEPPANLSAEQWAVLKTAFQADRKLRHRSCVAFIRAFADADRSTAGSVMAPEIPLPDNAVGVGSGSGAGTGTRRTRTKRVGAAVAALVLVASLAGGGMAYWRWQDGRFADARDQLLQDHRAALQASGSDLQRAIGALDEFRRFHAARSSGDLQPVTGQLAALEGRRRTLDARQAAFDQHLAEAARQTAANPAAARKSLDEAARLGSADASAQLPDLLAGLVPPLAARRAELERLNFEQELDGVSKQGAAALRADAKELSAAIGVLTDFTRKHRPDRAKEIEPLERDLATLQQRHEALNKRRAAFEQLLADAQALLAADPRGAVQKIEEAQRLGQEDRANGFPELAAVAAPSVAERIAAAKRAAAEKGAREFQASYESAKGAAGRKEWTAVRTALAAALKELSVQEHAAKSDAEGLMKTAVAELARRDDFAPKLQEGLRLLQEKQFQQAKEALTAARNAWPESPDAPQVEKCLADAERGLADIRYREALRSAEAQRALRQWDEAERLFKQALDEKAGDTAATKGLELAVQGRAADALQQARAARDAAVAEPRNAQRWADAKTAARRALDLARGDKAEPQKLNDEVDAGETASRGLVESDRHAAEARTLAQQQQWEAAGAALEKALAAAPRSDLTELQAQVANEIAKSKGLAHWDGDVKTLSYKGREFVVGARGAALKEWPLLGHMAMPAPIFADQVIPTMSQSQDAYVIFEKTKQRFLAMNVIFTTSKNPANGEKCDWVGEITPGGRFWQGELTRFRQYDKIGGGSGAPYHAMGRDFPVFVNGDGSAVVQENYFGNVKFEAKERDVSDEMAKRIIDAYDKHFRKKD
jgi:serine/threonine-protein kinase